MHRVRRGCVVVFALFLFAGAVVSVPVQAADHAGPLAAQLGDSGLEPDGVLLRADLRENGDADFTVEYRIRLNDENTTAAFDSLRADIEANETAYTTTFADRMRSTARAAENATGREMVVRNVSVRATRQQLPQAYGVVTYQFEWGGFAATTDEGLAAGDALAGLFLDQQSTLVIGWPDGFASTDVEPRPDERRDDAVVWVGPTDFGNGQPAVTVSASAASEVGGTTERSSNGGGNSPLLALGGLVVVAVGVIVVVVWRRSGGAADRGPTASGATEADDPPTTSTGTVEATASEETDSQTADGTASEPSGVATTAEGGGVDGSTATAEPADDDVAEEGGEAPWEDELLSNEETVLLLLKHNDGRMKQQAVAAELSWSDAKTSQVIGKLRDEDEIETFRIGRENVVSLPDSGLSR